MLALVNAIVNTRGETRVDIIPSLWEYLCLLDGADSVFQDCLIIIVLRFTYRYAYVQRAPLHQPLIYFSLLNVDVVLWLLLLLLNGIRMATKFNLMRALCSRIC